MSRLLATPGTYGDSAANLRRADSAFDVLDRLMRDGAPLPSRWPVERDGNGHEHVTVLYDSVSESLREVGGPLRSFASLRRAVADWHELDTVLRSGGPLPEPWQR
ncbi:hypothetical protein [Nocardiopsis terrae]|uniref:hypothetical protein n=1 Tax=Nocardiopsis terrae TaxID=372655 RepID=UPI001E339727|nr:hypothetical protein [Nocardiopsis terrae]